MNTEQFIHSSFRRGSSVTITPSRHHGIDPPGPPANFSIAGLLEQMANPLEYYMKSWKEYGDYVRLRGIPGVDWYLLTHPAAAEHILQTHQQNYRKPDVFNKPMMLLVGNGILTSEGDFWMKQRRLAQPAFHRQRIATMADDMARCIEESLNDWHKIPSGTAVDVSELMTKLTLKVVGSALFSTDISDSAASFGPSLRSAFEHINYKMGHPISAPEWFPTPGNLAFKRARQVLYSTVDSIIDRRLQDKSNEKNDLLSMLLAAVGEDSMQNMTKEQLRMEVITLLIAGHDTVAAALTWTWYLLGTNPQCQATLHDELRSVLGGRRPTFSDLAKLEYSMMIFEETLRLYPPAWGQPREAKEDDVIANYTIRKGTAISLCQYITHRHPEFWDEPEKFDPTRFTADKTAQRAKFAYFPFGGGQRVCIGNNFALMEGQLAIASIAQRFQFELLPNQTVVEDPTFVLRPKNGLRAYLRAR